MAVHKLGSEGAGKASTCFSNLGDERREDTVSRGIPAYLVNYTPFTERKKAATECLQRAGIVDIVPINEWDREALDQSLENSLARWDKFAKSTAHILYYNMLKEESRDGYTPKSIEMQRSMLYGEIRSMLSPRSMTSGEISVCLKHFCALSMIAIGKPSYGIIAEDDILPKPDGAAILKMVVEEAFLMSADYIDMAGGCGLNPSLPEKDNMRSMGLRNLCSLDAPRTRTAACYMVSRDLARSLVNEFLPLAMPIDWHLQALIASKENHRVFWTIDPVFIHGSEEGTYKSWREDVR